jgi:hypothetical protein
VTATVHDLKTIPPYWSDVAAGVKTFEVRHTIDRTFALGDELVLREWVPDNDQLAGCHTGRVAHARITYLLTGPGFGVPDNLAVLGITIIPGYCVCGDAITGHHLTDSGRRTYCCSGSQAGQCPCKQATPVGQVA